MINKIVTFIIGAFTFALGVSLGIGYITVGMTGRIERGCTLLCVCVTACIGIVAFKLYEDN